MLVNSSVRAVVSAKSTSCLVMVAMQQQQVRHKHRVYIQKPYPRPKLMQVIEDLSKPILGSEFQPTQNKCEIQELRARESQLTEYEQFLARRLSEMFDAINQNKTSGLSGMVVALQPPSVNGREWREIKIKFQRQGIQLRVFHPRVISHVLETMQPKFAVLKQLLPAPMVLGFAQQPNTLGLAQALRQSPDMTLLGCCVYDRTLSKSQLEQLNELGTDPTALVAQTIMAMNSGAGQLVRMLRSPSVQLVRILKAHLDQGSKAAASTATATPSPPTDNATPPPAQPPAAGGAETKK